LGRKAELAAGGMSKTKAEGQAAEDALAMSKKTGLFKNAGFKSEDTLQRKMKEMSAVQGKKQPKKPLSR
jgi:hypothetical protein